MNKYRRIILLVLGITLTVASGVLHGYMSQRWGADERLQQAAVRLSEFPQQIGPWELQEERELSRNAIKMLQCVGYLNHEYQHVPSGRRITVTVMVGPGSTMAIHTPEICYESRNFTLRGNKKQVAIRDANQMQHSFWSVNFQANDTSSRMMQVLYAWTAGDAWNAPDHPRFAYAGERVLYKMQVAEFGRASDLPEDGTADEFLQDYLPRLQKCLVEP